MRLCWKFPVLIVWMALMTFAARAERWLVRADYNPDSVSKAVGIQVARRFRNLPWLVVDANEAGARYLREAARTGALAAEPDEKVRLASVPDDPLIASQAFVQPANAAADIHLPQAWDIEFDASGFII